MSRWSIDGKSGMPDIRSERIGAGTVGGMHILPSSIGGIGASNTITPIDRRVLYYTAGGIWGVQQKADVNNFLGFIAKSNTPPAYATIQFSGTSLAIIGNNGPNFGRADIYIDGVLAVGALNTFTPLAAAYYTGGGLDAASTSIALSDATLFTAPGTIIIDGEEITYTGISTNTLTDCARGANSTTASVHQAGSMVYAANSVIEGYSPYRQDRVLLWRKANMSPGSHTLTLVVRPDKHASSTDYYTELGGFVLGGTFGSENIYTNIRHIPFSGTTNGSGILTGVSLTSPDTNQQFLTPVSAYPLTGAVWAFPMLNPTDGTYSIATNAATTAITGVLSVLYLGQSI